MFRTTATAITLVLGLTASAHATEAIVDFTCNMTSVKNNMNVIYHFHADTDPYYVREVSVWRDGVRLTPERTYDTAPKWTAKIEANKATFWSEADPGWSLVEVKGGQATVFTPAGRVSSSGYCAIDSATPVTTASAPSAPAYSSSDIVPLAGNPLARYATASVGGHGLAMLVDSGADGIAIPSWLADQLISEGKATEGESGEVNTAGGGKITVRHVAVNSISLGSHTATNVLCGVISDGDPLLGTTFLGHWGAFTLDLNLGTLKLGS
jgi:hypothetical protein